MVRCSENRSKTRYDQECVNARLAVARIQAREEAAGKAALEASSEKKRDALRRTQAAAAEARRRAAEAERLREEAEYLAQFGVAPPGDGQAGEQPANIAGEAETNSATANGGAAAPESDAEAATSDLEAVREELKRRNEEAGDQGTSDQ